MNVIYLYLKTHNVTGLKYLGMTIKDPFKYRGSGLYWNKHIKLHGNDVNTLILKICSTNEELVKFGLYYSNLWNIVESVDFANLVPELGNNSSGMLNKKHKVCTKEKISQTLMCHNVTDKTREKISITRKELGYIAWNKGKKNEYNIFTEEQKKDRSLNNFGVNNPFYGKQHTDEFKNNQRTNQKTQIKCTYCDKIGAIRIMKRWHFDNCKQKESN